MKKIITVFILLISFKIGYAQTGIGTTTPGAKLHVKSNGNTFRLEGTDHSYLEFFPQGPLTRHAYFGFGTPSGAELTIMNQFNSGTLVLGTNNLARMTIAADGKVGFGTNSPATALHIQNGNTSNANPGSNSIPSIYVYNSNNASSSADAVITTRTNSSNGGNPYASFDVNGVSGFSMGIRNTTGQFAFVNNWNFSGLGSNNNYQMIFNRTGQSRVIIPEATNGLFATDWPVGWGGGLATYDINAAGIQSNTYATRSDRRLKNNIKDLATTDIKKYLSLRPVSYYMNKSYSDKARKQYGLIAQEVETIFPEIVLTATDSIQTKSMNYQALHALTIKVIQTQQKQIDALELKNKQMELVLRKIQTTLKNNK